MTTATPPSPARHAELVRDKTQPQNRGHRHRPHNLDPFECGRCRLEATDTVALEALRTVEALASEFAARSREVLPMNDPAYVAGRVEVLLRPGGLLG